MSHNTRGHDSISFLHVASVYCELSIAYTLYKKQILDAAINVTDATSYETNNIFQNKFNVAVGVYLLDLSY